ncbi:MAG: ATP-dependent Clp protease proteolytic subunit [Micromonosporaceae bacterium]
MRVELRRDIPPEVPGPDPRRHQPEPDPPPASHAVEPWLAERLFAQRMVMLHGPVTAAVSSRTVAQLLALDGTGGEPVRLHLSCPDGELDAVFALMDGVELIRVPVHATVTGELGGAALGVLAAVGQRVAYRHARFRLAEPRAAEVSGTADQIVGHASRHLQLLDELIVRLAELTGRRRSLVETDLAETRLLTAEQARDYGLITGIVGPTS